MRTQVCFKLCLLGVLIGCLHSTAAQAITIDRFQGQFYLEANNLSGNRVVTNEMATPVALGGTRSARVELLSQTGQVFIDIDTLQPAGAVEYSEYSVSYGYGELYYDGNLTPGIDNAAGLGGIDLTEDKASAFSFDVIFYDLPGLPGQEFPMNLFVTAYDASDPSGGKWSRGKINVRSRYEGGAHGVYQLPFNAMTEQGPLGGADFRNIGAIAYRFNDDGAARQFMVSSLRTNGLCAHVPVNGLIYDACGVCGGNDSSCKGCDGVPNSGKLYDACGVCDGDGSTCICLPGCDGIPGSGKVYDPCGVCGGDSSACAGCDGVPNSGAAYDRCGVCGGDGQSYLGCKTVDNTAVIKISQETLLAQITWTRRLAKKAQQEGGNCSADLKKAEKFYKKANNVTATYPVSTTECANTALCAAQNLSVNTSEYDESARQLMEATQSLVDCLGQIGFTHGGVCKRTPAECQEDVQNRLRERQRQLQRIKKLYRASINTSSDIPQITTICCDDIK